jgi:hypothetical protein
MTVERIDESGSKAIGLLPTTVFMEDHGERAIAESCSVHSFLFLSHVIFLFSANEKAVR